VLHLANFSLILILWVNIFGLSLATGAITKIRNAWLNLTLGPLLLCSVMFFVEFIHGFGSLLWAWPITTMASIGLIYVSARQEKFQNTALAELKRRIGFNIWRHPAPYLCFMLVFSYALLWRYVTPDADATSEKMPDLSYICSYLPGATLPAMDAWLYPYLSTQYYSFQYYGAALMGRIFGMDPGTVFNLGFCTLIALSGTAAIGVCRETAKSMPFARKWTGWLVPSAWLLGGSGVSGIIYLLTTQISPWASMRFVGCTVLDKAPVGTTLAHWNNVLNHLTYNHQGMPMDLPGEPFAYSIYLGDYHPPLSGYYLALVAILALTLYHREKLGAYLAIPGACFSWSIVSDTWNLPVELIALVGWCFYNFFGNLCRVVFYGRNFRELEIWKILYLIAGGVGGYLTIYPYFRHFAVSMADYNTSMKLVEWDAHSPILLWVLFMLPAFALSILALFSRERSTFWLGVLGFALLFFTEFVYINDAYGGPFHRFNTVLKWWPWVSAIILLTLGVRILCNRSLWIYFIGLFFVAYPLAYTYDLAKQWLDKPKDHVGQLSGNHYVLNDDNRLLFMYLKSLPRGVSLEDPDAEGFASQPALSLFAGQECYMGWLGHEQLWRGYAHDIRYRFEMVKFFYSGNMPDAAEWLQAQNIQYVVWYKEPNKDREKETVQESVWSKINEQLRGSYRWHDTFSHDDHIGLWIRN
jgi:hypothetical protein